MALEGPILPAGTTWVDPGGPFGLVPRALWSRHQMADERGLLPMSLNCLLVLSEGKTILVDNGLGDKLEDKMIRQWGLESPDGTLIETLAKQGVKPEDIDIMLETHLHSDHCSGNTTLRDGKLQATFPNAEYWVQRVEFSDAMHPNGRTGATYLPENFVGSWGAGRCR